MSKESNLQLRAFFFIDRMQPQFAAYFGTVTSGDIPVAGMSQLYVELAPGNEVFRVVDMAVKATDVKPGVQMVEREFGMLEVHSDSQESVREAGRVLLDRLGFNEEDRIRPKVASVQLITNVSPYQAQLMNRARRGSMLVPGEALFVLEVTPAAYINVAANEAEKSANVRLIDLRDVGRFGRLFMAGSEAEARTAQLASIAAIEKITGVEK
jgi:ethanolamine utilization microcompartment shell protein EutS